jgi:hypothetical protein
MNPLRHTNEEMVEQLRDRQRRQFARMRLECPIHEIDRLISELEELLLLGRARVPSSLEARLTRLAATLPAPAPELRTGVTIVRLMDQLYEVQGRLLNRRVDRTAYAEVDTEAEIGSG